jgi:23S rRNA-/tRNA-specific pseudouridylate synthase
MITPGRAVNFCRGGLAIIHEDRDLIVVDKPPGLLTISTDKEKSRTAYFILTNYVRKGVAKSRNRIFIVHRLDRETSGILIFAKNGAAEFRLQSQWHWEPVNPRRINQRKLCPHRAAGLLAQ